MKKYNFLFKPLFFIFNLLVATWLVLKIEKIKPSDFSKRPSLFNAKSSPKCDTCNTAFPHTQHHSLKKLCADYKYGLIDSTEFDQKLEDILRSLKEGHSK